MGIAPHEEGAAAATRGHRAPRMQRQLRQRLMVMCPETGLAVDTGFELAAMPTLRGTQVLFDCMECGQDHSWQIENAFLD